MKFFFQLLLALVFLCLLTGIQGCSNSEKILQYPQFTLEWEEHFDAFDRSRWAKATHTWKSNLARFKKENVTFQNGTMRLHLKKEKTAGKDFTGAEYRTKEQYLYGRYVVRAKFPKGSGIVSSFFTYRDPAIPKWQEIDVEVLGKDTSRVQFTHHWGNPPKSNYIAETFDMTSPTDADFHEYVFEWIPGQITWFLDGREMYVASDENIPHLPQQIMMNIWINDDPDWAGEVDESALPTYAEYDYVKYYRLDLIEE